MSRFGDDCRGLDAAYDSISFDPATCILTASGVGVDLIVADLSAIVDKVEHPDDIVTRIEVRPDGLFYVNEVGDAFLIPADTVTTFVTNADGSHTYTNEAGDTYTIPAPTKATPVSTFSYDKDKHSVTHNGVEHFLNRIRASFDPVACAYVIEDEVGDAVSMAAVKSTVTVTPNTDGSQTITHFDGCSKITTFDTQPLMLDTKGDVDQVGSLITIEGDNKTIQFDICSMVANLCNSTFFEFGTDGSWKHKDNAGNVHTYTLPAFVKSVCYYSADGTPVQGEIDDNGQVCLPYTQVCMKVATQDGDLLDVTFDPDSGCYTIPFTESEDTNTFGTVSDYDDDNFLFAFPDGTSALVCKFPAKAVISGSDNVTVVDHGHGVFSVSVDPDTFGSVDSVSDEDFFLFTFPDGTEAKVCKYPAKSVVAGTGGVSVEHDGNGTYTVSIEHPLDTVRSMSCIDAEGVEHALNIDANGKAVIPYKPECIRQVNADGAIVEAAFDAATGCYTLPYEVIAIRMERQDGTFVDVPFDPATGTYTIPFALQSELYGTVDANSSATHFKFSFPDGTTADVCKDPVKSVTVTGDLHIDNTDPINPVISYDTPTPTVDTHGTVDNASNLLYYVFSFPDGTTATVCKSPVCGVTVEGDLEIDNTDPNHPVLSYTAPAATVDTFGSVDDSASLYYAFSFPDGTTATVCKTPVCEVNVIGDLIIDNTDPTHPVIEYTTPPSTVNTYGTVDSTTSATHFNFTFPDGTTASVCKFPLKDVSVLGDLTIDKTNPAHPVIRYDTPAPPVIPPPLQFEYVAWDAVKHAYGLIEGTGTATDKIEIPVCCDVEPPCVSNATVDCPADTLTPCIAGTTRTFTLNAVRPAVDGMGSEGHSPYAGQTDSTIPESLSAAGLLVPIPTATAGNILSLHVVHGEEEAGIGLKDSPDILGTPVITAPTNSANLSAPTTVHGSNAPNSAHAMHVYLFDVLQTGSGGTLNIQFPNNLAGNTLGVVNYVWAEISASDGLPIDKSMTAPGSNVLVTGGNYEYDNNPNQMAQSNSTACGALVYTAGRHPMHPTNGSIEAINDGDTWTTYGAGTDVYDTNSWDLPFDPGAQCHVSTGLFSIPPNTNYNLGYSTNLSAASNSDSDWSEQARYWAMGFDCTQDSPASGDCNGDLCPVNWVSNCDGTPTITSSYDLDFVVAAGDSVTVTPFLDGVALPGSAVVVTNSGVASITHNETLTVNETLSAVVNGDSGTHTLQLRVTATNGAGSSVSWPQSTINWSV